MSPLLREGIRDLYRAVLTDKIDEARRTGRPARAEQLTAVLAVYTNSRSSMTPQTTLALTSAFVFLGRFGLPGDTVRLEQLLQGAGRDGGEGLVYLWDGTTDPEDAENGNGPTTLAEALASNLEDEAVVELLLGLEVGGEYQIGGGAAPLLTVRRVS